MDTGSTSHTDVGEPLFLVFATPLAECFRRNAARRHGLRSASVPPSVIQQQFARLAHVLRDPGHLQGGRVVVVRPADAERFRFELPLGVGNTRAARAVIPCASRCEVSYPGRRQATTILVRWEYPEEQTGCR